jgi:hypothetical protein
MHWCADAGTGTPASRQLQLGNTVAILMMEGFPRGEDMPVVEIGHEGRGDDSGASSARAGPFSSDRARAVLS